MTNEPTEMSPAATELRASIEAAKKALAARGGGFLLRKPEPKIDIFYSRDNGQTACGAHKGLYGRIPWRRMTAAEVSAMNDELSDIKPRDESLCEICSRDARHARIEARRAGK